MRYLLALAILLLIVGLVFLVVRWPQGASKTFSQHAAAQKASIIYYFLLFAVTIPMLSVFFYGYFIPTYHLSFVFSVAIALGLAGQLIAGAVPEVGGWKLRVHRTSTGWSAFGLFVATIYLAYELPLSPLVFGFSLLTIVVMMCCSGLVFRSFVARQPFEHRYFLWLQVVYYVMFFGSIGLVTYLG